MSPSKLFAFVLEGSGELNMKEKAPRMLAAGEAFQAPPDTVHFLKIGDDARVRSTLVVRKGEPFTQLAVAKAVAPAG